MKSYDEWTLVGRQVRAGQQARWYDVHPEGTKRTAIFEEDQTEERDHESREGWLRLTAEECQAQRTERKPKVRVDYNSNTRTIQVWCGANKKAIAQLRGHGFTFKPSGYRWVAKRDEIGKTVRGLAENGFDVEAFVDGVPWDDVVAI